MYKLAHRNGGDEVFGSDLETVPVKRSPVITMEVDDDYDDLTLTEIVHGLLEPFIIACGYTGGSLYTDKEVEEEVALILKERDERSKCATKG